MWGTVWHWMVKVNVVVGSEGIRGEGDRTGLPEAMTNLCTSQFESMWGTVWHWMVKVVVVCPH